MTDPAPAQATPPAAPAATATAEPTAPVATPAAQPTSEPNPELVRLQAEVKKWQDNSKQWESRAQGNFEELKAQKDTLKLVAEKLGIEMDGKPDPAKLTEQVTNERQAREAAERAARASETKATVMQVAFKAGADPDALVDSMSFMARVSALDSNSADFSDQVKSLVEAQVKDNPSLAMATRPSSTPQAEPVAQQPAPPPLPASSGGDFSGAPGGGRQWTMDDVNRATPEEVVKAINAGLLAEMGVGKSRARFGH